MQQVIMHIDMDAFFASVEQYDHPEWRGKPVIVGGRERGVVSAASYEARRYGVHSAMPVAQAQKRCPHGIFTRGNMERYKTVSSHVMSVLDNFSPVVEKASIDEAYLDITGMEYIFESHAEMGRQLKKAVRSETGLNCSVGIAPVKFLAKIASDLNKPDGLSIITPEQMSDFLATMPVRKIPGVGKKFMIALQRIGVETCADVLRYSQDYWKKQHGKGGIALWERAQGIDHRKVEPYNEPKSESAENTFEKDTYDKVLLKKWLLKQTERVSTNLRQSNLKGRTVTLKIKYSDFKQITRSQSLTEATASTNVIFETVCTMLDEIDLQQSVRLIGVGVTNYTIHAPPPAPKQLSLFDHAGKSPNIPTNESGTERVASAKEQKLDETLDSLRKKFGKNAIIRGRLFDFK